MSRRCRWRFSRPVRTSLVFGSLAALAALLVSGSREAGFRLPEAEIPAFARKYRTSCSTCHTAAPKLNVLGEAFRLNGYRFPENDELLRKEEPVPLGADPWKDLWPRAIWPGEVPGVVPLAFRVLNDIELRRASTDFAWTFRFPEEIYLLSAATLGDEVSVFLETEWSRETDLAVLQAKVKVQDPLPRLPARAVNLWVGVQNLYLFTFADRQIDRAARQNFLWQTYRVSDIELTDLASGRSIRSSNDFRLRQTQPALELNGIIGSRLYYGFGLAQGASELTADNNNHKDFFYKLRYKIGGLDLEGRYGPRGGPIVGGGGQLLDRSLTLELFGYVGAEPVKGDRQDVHRSFGAAARALYGTMDIGAGYVWGENENPWGGEAAGGVTFSSFFGKAEFLFFPWLIGSLKFDAFDGDLPGSIRANGLLASSLDQSRILPGLIVLMRQNVRGVIELELFAEHDASRDAGEPRPRNLWFRLDVAF